MRWCSLGSLCVAALLLAAACEYRAEVGRSVDVPSPDAAPSTPDADAATAPADCNGFQIPTDDCTAPYHGCQVTGDCADLGGGCNTVTDRCFAASSNCVGTPCIWDMDCPVAERCNQTANTCFDPNTSQVCMPCFLLDQDCGLGICDSDLGRCI